MTHFQQTAGLTTCYRANLDSEKIPTIWSLIIGRMLHSPTVGEYLYIFFQEFHTSLLMFAEPEYVQLIATSEEDFQILSRTKVEGRKKTAGH